MLKKIVFIIILIALLSNIVYAEEDLNSLREALNRNSGINYINSSSKSAIMGMAKGIFEIVQVIVVTLLVIKLLIHLVDYKNSDAEYIKSQAKNKVLWLGLGLIFVSNFWKIFKFLSNIFKS